MPRTQWTGFIKDYDGAHLMECYIHPTINYLDVPAMVERQREYIYSRIRQMSKSNVVYPGLDCFEKGKRLTDIMDVPGLREGGWSLGQLAPVSTVSQVSSFFATNTPSYLVYPRAYTSIHHHHH